MAAPVPWPTRRQFRIMVADIELAPVAFVVEGSDRSRLAVRVVARRRPVLRARNNWVFRVRRLSPQGLRWAIIVMLWVGTIGLIS